MVEKFAMREGDDIFIMLENEGILISMVKTGVVSEIMVAGYENARRIVHNKNKEPEDEKCQE